MRILKRKTFEKKQTSHASIYSHALRRYVEEEKVFESIHKGVVFTSPPIQVTVKVLDQEFTIWYPYLTGIASSHALSNWPSNQRMMYRLDALWFTNKPVKPSENPVLTMGWAPNSYCNGQLCLPPYIASNLPAEWDQVLEIAKAESYETVVNKAFGGAYLGASYNADLYWYHHPATVELTGRAFSHQEWRMERSHRAEHLHKMFEKWSELSKKEVLALPLPTTGQWSDTNPYHKMWSYKRAIDTLFPNVEMV